MALAGCVHYQAQPLSPETTVSALTARSLNDEGLRHFLTQNLGREPTPWPLPSWNFETLTWVAFYYQPSLDVARAQWDVARAGVRTAAARPNPVLTVTPGYDTNAPAGVSPWFPSIGVDFLLETAGKRGHRADAARLSAEAARLDILASAWAVRSELRQALIDASAAEHRRALFEVQVGLQQEAVTILEQRQQAGSVSAPEVSAARQNLLRAEASAAEAQREAPQARLRLAQALGLSAAALDGVHLDDILSVTSPALSGDQLAAARRLALQSRSDVLGALARYEASQAALQLEVAKQYPDLQLGPGYQYDLGENKWSLALAVELPVFNQHQGPIAEAEARRREAAAQFVATQARAIAEIDGAIAAQGAAASQVTHLTLLCRELQDQTALMRARLAAGDADQLQNKGAQIELTYAMLALLDAQAGGATAAGRLEDALQVPFPNLADVVNLPRGRNPDLVP